MSWRQKLPNLLQHSLFFGLCVAPMGGASAQSTAAPFPVGAPISLLLGGTPGGTNDALARIVARYLGKYLPGNPQIVPKNMPGAGGVRVPGYLHSAARRDGTELGSFNRGIVLYPMHQTKTFEPEKLLWLASPSGATDLCVTWHTVPIKSVADVMKDELIIGTTGPDIGNVLLLQRLSGAKLRSIAGYDSKSINLAMERGEVQGRCSAAWESIKSTYPDWVTEKKVNIIVQFALKKHPELPEVPLIMDFAKSAIDQQAAKVLMVPNLIGYPFAAPPGLLPEVNQILVGAFEKLWADSEVVAEAAKIQFAVSPVSAGIIQKAVEEVFAFPPEVVERAAGLIKQ